MKKTVAVLIAVLLLTTILQACGTAADGQMNTTASQVEWEESEVEAENRKMIAEAMGVDENSRNLRFILSGLNSVGAGRLQSVVYAEENGEKTLTVVSEDSTEYRVFLTNSGGLDAVQNLTTGEWPIRSER